MPTVQKRNPYRISLELFLQNEGFDNASEYIEACQSVLLDSVQPALCSEFCEVEPDGKCEHGCPSISLVLGVI